MNRPNLPMTLGRCLLAGLFTGLITALVVVVFDVVYRRSVDLIAYDVVMPLSIFLAFPLINLIAGGLFSLFTGHLRRGQPMYTAIVLLVMIVVALVTAFGSRSADADAQKFKGLLLGLEVIEGVMGAFFIPFFANHAKIFLTEKDIRGEE